MRNPAGKKKILVIDAQGGGLGKQLIQNIRKEMPQIHIMAVGTNSAATATMLKAGATEAATGMTLMPASSSMATPVLISFSLGVLAGESTAIHLMFSGKTPFNLTFFGAAVPSRQTAAVNMTNTFFNIIFSP